MDNNTPGTDVVAEEVASVKAEDVESEDVKVEDTEAEVKEDTEAEDAPEPEIENEVACEGEEKSDKTHKKRRRKFSYYFTNGIIFTLLAKLFCFDPIIVTIANVKIDFTIEIKNNFSAHIANVSFHLYILLFHDFIKSCAASTRLLRPYRCSIS